MKSRGFTLIEVLVALSIVAIALFAGTQATSALARSSQRQTDLLLAQICAENELIKIRLARQIPSVGDSSIDCLQGARSFKMNLEVRPTQNPSILVARVQVSDGEAGYGILQISTVVGRY